jgi:hypothetical protein
MRIQSSFTTLVMCIVVILGAPLWAQNTDRTPPARTHCKVQSDEIEVFVSYLKLDSSSPALTVLVTRTGSAPVDISAFNLQLATKGRAIPPEVRADFEEKNKLSCAITPFSGIENLRFISKAEHDRLFQSGWADFHKTYGKNASVLELSRVGFNQDKTLALFHVSGGMDRMAGGGTLYLLERKGSKWEIKTSIQTWAT